MTTVGDDRAQALQRYLASRSRGQEEGEARDGVRPRLPGEAAVLSFGQEQIWAHEQLVPERTIYNEAFTLVRRGPLEIPVFARAFAEIVRRHEVWRTTFRAEDGIPVPVVHPSMAIPIDVIDLRGVVGAGSRDANVEVDRGVAAAEAQARKPFDLERGPLVRVTVCHLSDDHHLIYMVVHQIVFDGVSIYGVFLREIAALYDAFAAGEPSPLPELKLQYGDFAAWERRTFDEEQRRRNLEAVVRRLEGAPSGIDVGLDRQRPARRRYRGDEEQLLIPAPIRDALAAVAREAGTTLFVALSGLYAVLLARYSGRDDLLIGTVASSRTDARLEPLIGFFLNTLVLRADLRAIPGGEHDDATAAQPEADPDLSFRGLLTRLRQDTIDAL